MGHEPHGFGRHRRRGTPQRLPVIRARRGGPIKRKDGQDDTLSGAMMGIRVLSCFSVECPTLTSVEIGFLLHLPAGEVTRIATRLMGLNYLAVDLSIDEDAWMLMSDDG